MCSSQSLTSTGLVDHFGGVCYHQNCSQIRPTPKVNPTVMSICDLPSGRDDQRFLFPTPSESKPVHTVAHQPPHPTPHQKAALPLPSQPADPGGTKTGVQGSEVSATWELVPRLCSEEAHSRASCSILPSHHEEATWAIAPPSDRETEAQRAEQGSDASPAQCPALSPAALLLPPTTPTRVSGLNSYLWLQPDLPRELQWGRAARNAGAQHC